MRSEEEIRQKLEAVREHREGLEDNVFVQLHEDLGRSTGAIERFDTYAEALEWVLEDPDDE